jgi:hypothetical protein
MMTEKLEYYQTIAKRLIDRDRERNEAFRAYQAMYHCEWELPPELRALEWVRKDISTDPHDAIEGAARVLSNAAPKITILPLSSRVEDKQVANEREVNLGWQLKAVNRRRSERVEYDVTKSALMYQAVAALVIDLEDQLRQRTGMKADTAWLKAAMRSSRFMVQLYDPSDVHVDRSGIMVHRVLLCQKRPAQEVLDEWGEAARKLKDAAKDNLEVIYYDYFDLTDRVVWCETGEGDGQAVVLVREPHKLGFIPWVANMGGSSLEQKEKHRYHPMLYPIHRSGTWETQNVVKTLYTSEVIAHSGSPRYKEEGPNAQRAVIDYGDPARKAEVQAGNVLSPLQPPAIDSALAEIDDRQQRKMEKSTVSRVLLGGEVPAGTAFSTLNLQTQTAIGVLKPAKKLAEQALAEILTIMLHWTANGDTPLRAYGWDDKSDNMRYGAEYVIQPDEIDPDATYIEVELTPDEPTDRQQRAMTAIQLVQARLLSREKGMEAQGITDPQAEMERIIFEQLFDNELTMIIQRAQAQVQLELQQQMAAMQAQAQQQQMAQAQAQEQALAAGGGQGMAPPMGGLPPAQMNPGATREQVMGQDRTGNSLAGV